MTTTKPPTRTARKAAPPRKSTKAKADTNGVKVEPKVDANGAERYEPPTDIRPPEEFKVEEKKTHPIYGDKPLYTYQPLDGSEPIVFPHISTCRPTPVFFYDNRNKSEMHQAFAWMDLAGVPDHIGRRLFVLPDHEQATLLREWFAGLNLTAPPGVSPPGE